MGNKTTGTEKISELDIGTYHKNQLLQTNYKTF